MTAATAAAAEAEAAIVIITEIPLISQNNEIVRIRAKSTVVVEIEREIQ